MNHPLHTLKHKIATQSSRLSMNNQIYDRAVFEHLKKKGKKCEYGIKIGHGVHSSCLMTSKTILCQAVLIAKGGL